MKLIQIHHQLGDFSSKINQWISEIYFPLNNCYFSIHRDNEPLSKPQLPNGVLILESITAHDAGTYTCSAKNTLLDEEQKLPQKYVINVREMSGSPSFLIPPPSRITVMKGETAILECPGIGYPLPKAIWSRPNASIASDRTSVLNYGLQIVNAQPEDSDLYICRLDNGFRPGLTLSIQLEVQMAPVIIQPPFVNITDEGRSLELECIANGSPKPKISWLVNSERMQNDGNVHIDDTKLFIRSIEKKHAGIVQCFAKNVIGEAFDTKLLQVKPKQISGGSNPQPLGTIPINNKNIHDRGQKGGKSRKKHKHSEYIFNLQNYRHIFSLKKKTKKEECISFLVHMYLYVYQLKMFFITIALYYGGVAPSLLS